MDFPGNDWTDIEDLPVQQLIDKTAPTQLCTEVDQTSSPVEPLSLRLHEAFSMRAGWMQVLPGAPQTTPRGELWAFILALSHTRGPLFFTLPITWGSLLGFEKNAISSLLDLWRSFGLGSVFSWPEEAPAWRFAMLAATSRPRTWSRGARSFHSCWATAWPTRWRACQRILWTATRDRCSLTHNWSNLPRQSGRGHTWLTWPLTRWSRRSAPLANRYTSHAQRLERNGSGCYRRLRTRSQSRTTTIIASPVTPRYHKTGSTLGFSAVLVRRCSTCPPLSLLGAVHCTSLTRSPSWTTDVPGYARLAGTYLV